jgi:hypothetical protein
MRNPFKRNITLLISIIILCCLILSVGCSCNESCCSNIHLSGTVSNLLVGLISSTILLLLVELFQFLQDRKYGYLKGIYSRTVIAHLIENTDFVTCEKREEELTEEQKQKFEERNLSPIKGSRYVEINDYKSLGKDLIIELKYLYHGIYEGKAEYFKYWEQPFDQKTLVKFTLTLNISNLSTGAGSYKYVEYDDYGIYSFQINDNDKSEILVTFKNTIPNGLSEGYEKWKRLK